MSLPAGQRRALSRIEKALSRDHPGLGPLFATFTRLTGHEAMPATEQVKARRLRPGVTTIAALAVATGALLTLSRTLPSQPVCVPRTAAAAHVRSVTAGSQPACAAQQNNPSPASQNQPTAR